MRRAPATLLIALFGFLPIAPVLSASDPYANLPACCRRDGKHHCAMAQAMMQQMMRAMVTPPDSPELAQGTCPMFPQPGSSAIGPACSVAGAPVRVHGLSAVSPILAAHADPLSRSSYSRAGQKRGPPSFPA